MVGLLPTEIEAIRRALAPAVATPRGPAPHREKCETFAQFPAPKAPPSPGRTVNKVAAFAGVSGRTVEKIVEAKAALAHGEFGKMVEAELPFGDRTARMLMAVASDKRLQERNHGSVLPTSWRTLYDLTKLDDAEFDAAVEHGIIRPDMARRELAPLPMPAGVEMTTPPVPAPTRAARMTCGR